MWGGLHRAVAAIDPTRCTALRLPFARAARRPIGLETIVDKVLDYALIEPGSISRG